MRARYLLAWAVPLLGLGELALAVHQAGGGPSEQDYRELAASVRTLYRPGDLITVNPRWAEPLVRQNLGDDLMPVSLLGRADNETVGRVLAIESEGQKEFEFPLFRETTRSHSGPFTIRMLTNPQPQVAQMRLLDRVVPPYLEVMAGPEGDPRVCPFTQHGRVVTGGLGGDPTLPARRFQCPGGPPYVVGVTVIDDEEFRPRQCIFAHPSPDGQLTLLFRDVSLGSRLVGHAGFPWLISRDGEGTPVTLEGELEGAAVGSVVVDERSGWIRFEWLTKGQQGRRGDLELVVKTPSAQASRFCFTMESR